MLSDQGQRWETVQKRMKTKDRTQGTEYISVMGSHVNTACLSTATAEQSQRKKKTSVFHHCASVNAREISSWKIHAIPATSLKFFFIDSTNITEYELQSRYNEIDVWFCWHNLQNI